MTIYHNGSQISYLFHNGKHINKIFHNGECIYNSIAVGTSLYNGIPSKGIMLYGSMGGYSYNPLGINGNSIKLNAPLSYCLHGINIHFSNISYNANGEEVSDDCRISDIIIPKGGSSGSSGISSYACTSDLSYITASINGLVLSFSITNGNEHNQFNAGTITFIDSYPIELLSITSITAY